MSRLALYCAFLLSVAFAVPALTTASEAQSQSSAKYRYFRIGSKQDAVTKTQAGFALMGGGSDLDEAFRWMCEQAGGGDFLILRATGDGDYNPYVQALCKLNSVATLILPSREAASDPFVGNAIAHAEAIFIAGGDQANYVRNWTGTPVQREMNAAIRRGVPVGGTSAGLAVMGEWAYSAEGDKPDDPNLDAKTALMDPLGPRVSLVHGFLEIPALKGIITDTHFAKRNRMGRLLVFLARIHAMDPQRPIRGIGVEEKAAVLLDPDGRGTVVGHGSAYLVTIAEAPATLAAGKPMPNGRFEVQKVEPGKVDVAKWDGNSVSYILIAEDGKVRRSTGDGSIY